jgi:holo-[acyl-carrier protein] synthase
MLLGIGVDIVEIARIESALERFGERFAQRILTDSEIETFAARERKASFLASRFAAKEAVSKALGTGVAQGIGFRDIEIVNDALGKPGVLFHGAANRLAQRHGVCNALVSLSDERHYCVAMVTLESG